MNKEPAVKITLPGQKLYGKDIHVTTFTTAHIRQLVNVIRFDDFKLLVKILSECVDIDINKLTITDFNYLLHWQRINSYETLPMYQYWNCPKCGFHNESAVCAEDLIIDDLPDEYLEGVQIQLDSYSTPLKIRLQLIGDDTKLRNFYDELSQTYSEQDEYDFKLACMIESNFSSIKEALNFVQNELTKDDLLAVVEFEETFSYGVRNYILKDCSNPECKEKGVRVKYDFYVTRFLPTSKDRNTLRNRILVNKKPQDSAVRDSVDGLGEVTLDEKSSRIRDGERESASTEVGTKANAKINEIKRRNELLAATKSESTVLSNILDK